MNPLRNALGKFEESDLSRSSIRLKSTHRSRSIWSLDPDFLAQSSGPLQSLIATLRNILIASTLDENTFDTMIQSSYGNQQNDDQFLNCLKEIQFDTKSFLTGIEYSIYCLFASQQPIFDFVSMILLLFLESEFDLQPNTQISFGVLSAFKQNLNKKLRKISQKLTMGQLNDFQKIEQRFRKHNKPAYIQISETSQYTKLTSLKDGTGNVNSLEGSSKSHSKRSSGSSNEDKLSRLLSGGKNTQQTSQKNKERNQPQVVPTADSASPQNSISFASVVSQTMTVRSRRGEAKKPSIALLNAKAPPTHKSPIQKPAATSDISEKDQAFMFFKPKKASNQFTRAK